MIINDPIVTTDTWYRQVKIAGFNSNGNPVSVTIQLDTRHDRDIGELRCFIHSVGLYVTKRENSFLGKIQMIDRMLRR